MVELKQNAEKTWKNLDFDNLSKKKKPGKTWDFEQNSLKNLEF